MFKIGEEVIYTEIDYDINHYQVDYHFMTVGKKYSVIDYDYHDVLIKNDGGYNVSLSKNRFKSVLEFRKIKLKKICSRLVI